MSAEERVAAWNTAHPVGTRVRLFHVPGSSPPRMLRADMAPVETVTLGPAFVHCNLALITVRCHSGWHHLEQLEVIP